MWRIRKALKRLYKAITPHQHVWLHYPSRGIKQCHDCKQIRRIIDGAVIEHQR